MDTAGKGREEDSERRLREVPVGSREKVCT